MGRKSKVTTGPGQALIKRHVHAANDQKQGMMTGGRESKPLESLIDVRDLDEVMEQAELAGRILSSVNPLLPELLITPGTDIDTLEDQKEEQRAEEALHRSSLTIPRRPKWHPTMSTQQLDLQERQAFLNWRRGLAALENNEKLVLTPFEKNLDIWRQLWRVLERCDLVVMVVDARNPLFYRCPDLEAYVKEIDPSRKTMLLLNKADLLTRDVRRKWAMYLKKQRISFLFWSAKAATALLEDKARSLQSATSPVSEERKEEREGRESDDEEIAVLGREELLHHLQQQAEAISVSRKTAVQVSIHHHLDTERSNLTSGDEEGENGVSTSTAPARVVVGFVGYPNVGKSSTINALIGGKKTGVTSTPGKTKHFQTLIISDSLMLCDCPGLVFPSFTSSRSEMVAAGVLPIDRMMDHRGPIQVVASQIPRETLESIYRFTLPTPKPYEPQNRSPTAAELLSAYAQSRGQVSSSGLPDETKASRQILKDYLNGKLLYCYLPPNEEEINGVMNEYQISSRCDGDSQSSLLSERSSEFDSASDVEYEEESASGTLDSGRETNAAE